MARVLVGTGSHFILPRVALLRYGMVFGDSSIFNNLGNILKLCSLIFRYHVPRSFLNPNSNLLVILEEEKEGNPLGITIDTVSVTEVCGHVSSSHPPPVVSSKRRSHNQTEHPHLKYRYDRRPKVQLQCPYGKKISKVLFASFGSPKGNCWRHSIGSCHSPNSLAVVQKVSYYWSRKITPCCLNRKDPK